MIRRSSIQSSSSSFSDNSTRTSTCSAGPVPMRVFLVQTAKGLFSSSGGYRANICLLRYLASRGHCVRQLCYSHRGEADSYIRTMVESGRRNSQLRKRLLHLRGEHGKPGTDVKVHEFVLDDGVEVVALESEAFDAAFGGKNNTELARETANYIEVFEPSNSATVTLTVHKFAISNSHLT